MSSAVAKGWSHYPLSDVCFFQEGPGLRNWQYRNEGVKFINIKCIQGGDIDTSVAQHLSVDEVEEKYKHFLLDEGDYVLSSSGTIGRLALVKKHHLPLLLNTSVIRFRSIDENKLDKLFLRYFLQSKQFFDKISEQSQGSAQLNFGPTHLKLLGVLLPPLPEQKKIASILTSVDEVIETTQIQIDKLHYLKKATMNKLLTKGIGHTEFKDSEMGRVPKSWKVQKLSQICLKIQDGTHFSPSTEGNDFKYITSKNIRMGQLVLDNVETISEFEHRKIYKRCDVIKNDLLLTKDGANTGNIARNFLDEEFSLLSSVALIRPDRNICDAEYLLQFMMSDKAQNEIVEQMSGNAITRLTLTKINNFKVILPSLSEQIKIATSLGSIDQIINEKNQKLSQTQALKKSLMQDLLTGKVRVQVN